MDEDSKKATASNGFDGGVIPEVEAYAFLLVVTYLIDADKIELVSLNSPDLPAFCKKLQSSERKYLTQALILSHDMLHQRSQRHSLNVLLADVLEVLATGKRDSQHSHESAQQLQQKNP